ncbi:MAG: metal ABC transporter permease [Thermoguttaceae bacterium]|nr:metal ABC transporter permease [Thermoguttaceae bacterium]
MTELLFAPEFSFLRAAFLFTAAAALTFGLVGTFIVTRRIGYLAGAISHTAFGGIGIGFWLKEAAAAGSCGFGTLAVLLWGGENAPARLTQLAAQINPVIVAVLTAVASAVLIGLIQRYAKEREDALIGIIWTAGMALGLLFLDRTQRYVAVSDYLLGDILLISHRDLATILILDAAALLTFGLFFKRFEAVCFDEEFARLRGVRVDVYQSILLFLIAVTVVLTMRIAGMVLVIAILTIPASIASRLTRRLSRVALWSILICAVSAWGGIALSYVLNFSAGPMIVLLLSVLYGITVLATGKRDR